MSGRLASVLIGAALTANATTAPATSEAARDMAKLSVSLNGSVWTTEPTFSLFGGVRVLAPGARLSRPFFVRNRGGEPARMNVRVAVVDPERILASREVRMRVATARGWRQVHVTGGRLVDLRMPPGRIVPVKVGITMAHKARNASQDKRFAFSVRLRLTEWSKDRPR